MYAWTDKRKGKGQAKAKAKAKGKANAAAASETDNADEEEAGEKAEVTTTRHCTARRGTAQRSHTGLSVACDKCTT